MNAYFDIAVYHKGLRNGVSSKSVRLESVTMSNWSGVYHGLYILNHACLYLSPKDSLDDVDNNVTYVLVVRNTLKIVH